MDLAKEWQALILPQAFEILENKRLYILNLSDQEYDLLRDSLLRFLHFSQLFPSKFKEFDSVEIDLLSDLFIDSFIEEKPNFNQLRTSFAEISLLRKFCAFLISLQKSELLLELNIKIYNIFYS